MNTQMPITNAVSPKAPVLPASHAESLSPEVPFNQMLSKEVSNRNNAAAVSSTPAPAPAPTPAAHPAASDSTPKAQAQSKPADAAAPKEQEAAAATGTAAAAAASSTAAQSGKADGSKEASAAKNQDADQSKQDDEDDSVSTPASAQMLALVAGVGQLNQASQGQLGKKGSDQEQDELADKKHGKQPIGHIAAHGQNPHEALSLKAENAAEHGAGKGKEKGELLAVGGALEGKQVLDKGDGKNATALRGPGEKALPESSLAGKAGLSAEADASALTHTAGKFALPEAKMKGPEGAQQLPQAATAAAIAPAMQQALSLNQQAATNGQPVERLTPPVGSQGWDQAVGQKMIWMTSGGLQSASLTLNPPDLGPLQVVIHVNNDQADATFITAQPEVKQALENAMPKLREMMDQAGIQLNQATVNTGMPSQQQGASQQQAQGGGSGGARSGAGGGSDDGSDDGSELHVATVPVRPAASGGLGLVDTFA